MKRISLEVELGNHLDLFNLNLYLCIKIDWCLLYSPEERNNLLKILEIKF